MRIGLLGVVLVVLGACTTFNEDHFFQSLNVQDGRATNYYRLRIEGYAGLSKARYLSGYYDERAVDLFFNEIKTTEIAPIVPQNQIEPGTNVALKPLQPDEQRGVLVMILSTNAKAVADAIGQFAENQVAAQALTNLVSRGDLLEARRIEARFAAKARASQATREELQALIDKVPVAADGAANIAATQEAYLRVLNAIARALGSEETFTTFEAAAAFFRGVSAGRP
jgi:hypothetical protein